MDDLNSTMGGASYSVNRFRANVVVGGCPAWEEDSWRAVSVAGRGVVLLGVKPCTRCNVPDVDQESGEAGREVGRALVKHRWVVGPVLVGNQLGWGRGAAAARIHACIHAAWVV